MCGICGILGSSDKNLIERMVQAIRHRGPDGNGFYLGDKIILGIAKLNIAGIEHGKQPIFNEEKNMCIISDGEIYNHQELRRSLLQKGHKFTTLSDTEAILHAYEEYGDSCVNFLEGMFAFAIWDGRRLFLARDRLGIKPLFYTHSKSYRLFLFGSEIKAIFQCENIPRIIDEDALAEFMIFEDLSLDSTFFLNIKQLSPGSTLSIRWNKSSNEIETVIKKYWSFKTDTVSNSSEKEIIEYTKKLLEESVQRRMIGNGPWGVLLSGGLDSSLMSFILQAKSRIPIKAFTLGGSPEYPDITYARVVSKYLKMEFHEKIIDFDEVIISLPKMILASEHLMPPIATYLFNKAASRHVKVAFSGDGADTVFMGYRFYINSIKYGKLEKENLYKRIARSNFSKIRKNIFYEKLKQYPFSKTKTDSIFTRYLGLQNRFYNRYLWVSDRCSMAHGLKLRLPYLDDKLVKFTLSIPYNLMVKNKRLKSIPQQIAAHLGNEIMNKILSREKAGAGGSISGALKKLHSLAYELISDDYFERHPYHEFFFTKLDTLLFDLLHFIFVENKCHIPEGFSILNLYQKGNKAI